YFLARGLVLNGRNSAGSQMPSCFNHCAKISQRVVLSLAFLRSSTRSRYLEPKCKWCRIRSSWDGACEPSTISEYALAKNSGDSKMILSKIPFFNGDQSRTTCDFSSAKQELNNSETLIASSFMG